MAVTFEIERTFAAPREKVFEAHVDVDRYSAWMPNCERIEKLTDGPVGVGTRWRETRTLFKKSASEEFEIIDLERPTSLSLYCDGSRGSSGRGEYHFDYTFEELDGATRVRMNGKMDMGGSFSNLFARLLKGMFVKQIKNDMDALAAHLEA